MHNARAQVAAAVPVADTERSDGRAVQRGVRPEPRDGRSARVAGAGRRADAQPASDRAAPAARAAQRRSQRGAEPHAARGRRSAERRERRCAERTGSSRVHRAAHGGGRCGSRPTCAYAGRTDGEWRRRGRAERVGLRRANVGRREPAAHAELPVHTAGPTADAAGAGGGWTGGPGTRFHAQPAGDAARRHVSGAGGRTRCTVAGPTLMQTLSS